MLVVYVNLVDHMLSVGIVDYGIFIDVVDTQLESRANADTLPAGARCFQVLSIDGGGFKGMFAAVLLACLEADLGISVVDHFDLIVGTSTGGIVALGLGAGLGPSEITNFYIEHGPSIFGHPRWKAPVRLFRAKYRTAPLRHALEVAFGELTLGDSKVPLAIPSYDLCNDDVHLFRTPHSPQLLRDRRERMVDVALATTAAPTYLSAHKLRGMRLIDGGMWANNPTLVGIVEAVTTFGYTLAETAVFSIGTTIETVKRPARLDQGGLVPWAGDAIAVVLRSQSLTAHNHARLLLGEDRMLRVDPQVPAQDLRLDRVSPEKLRGRAEHCSRQISSQFRERFCGHRAAHLTAVPINKAS
jgi:uncharacterized protein